MITKNYMYFIANFMDIVTVEEFQKIGKHLLKLCLEYCRLFSGYGVLKYNNFGLIPKVSEYIQRLQAAKIALIDNLALI